MTLPGDREIPVNYLREGNQVFVGRNAVIGDDTVLETGAQVGRDVVIGDREIIGTN